MCSSDLGSAHVYSVTFGLACLVLQVFLRYETYVRYLKWLTLALLAYVAVVFLLDLRWLQVLRELALPRLALDHDTIMVLVAVFGTTISPYLFFWQSAQEVEEVAQHPDEEPLLKDPAEAPQAISRIRIDTVAGMLVSNVIALAIMIATAATLHAHGVTNIDTAAQAASHALRLRPGGESGGKTEGLYQHGVVWTSFSTTGSAAYLTLEAPRKEAPVSGCQFVGFTRDLRGLESELARRFALAFPRPDEFGAKAAEKCVAQARKPTCLRMTLNGSEKPEGSFTLAVQR